MTDWRPIVTTEEWDNHQRALFKVTVDNYESALSPDPLGVEGMRSRLTTLEPPTPDVPEDVSRRQDAERANAAGGELTDFASSLGASFLPVDGAPDPSTISEPLPAAPSRQSFTEFMAAHEGREGERPEYEPALPTRAEVEAQDAPASGLLNTLAGAAAGVSKQIGSAIQSGGRLLSGGASALGRAIGEGSINQGGYLLGEALLNDEPIRPSARVMPPELSAQATQAAGDVLNVVPGWQGANAAFAAGRGALTGSGVVPEDSLLADAGALALSVGAPGALRAGQKLLAPGLDDALRDLPRYGQQAARAVDDFGRQFPMLERGEIRLGTPEPPPPSTVRALGKAVDRLATDELPESATPILNAAAEEVARLRLDKFPEDVRPLIQEAAERMGFAQGQRRGVITDEVAEELADELGRTTEQWLRTGKAGRAYNTEEIRALANTITTQASRVRDLGTEQARLAAAGESTDRVVAQLMIEGDKLAALTALREGSKAEAGRALRAFAQEARLSTNPEDAISRIFAKVGGSENARTMASEYATMIEQGADPISMAKFWAKVEAPPVGFADWFTALRYNSMLSGPRTFAVNLIGNTLEVPWRLARDTAASTGRAIATRSKAPLVELDAELLGLFTGAGKGAKGFMEVIKHGLTEEQALAGDLPRSLASRLDPQQAERFPGLVRAAQPVATALESVGRVLSGADEFARQAAYGLAKGRLAAREATRKNLTGRAWEAEYERVMGDFTPRLERQAMEQANRMTYKGDMGGVGSLLNRAQTSDKQAVRVGSNLVLPFLRTVYHISARGVDRSPFGFAGTVVDVGRGKYGRGGALGGLVGKGAFGGEMLPDAEKGLAPLGERLGDNAIGGMMTFWFGQQALAGNISGAGPENAQERNVLRAQGWQPYSIKLGDKWVSYSNWGPVAIPLAMAAGAGESVTYRKPGSSGGEMFMDAAGRFAQLAADQPYLQGIGAIYKATQEPERYGQSWLTSTLSTLIPFGAALNTAGQAFDPLERRADPGDIAGAVAKRIPVLREQLPVARTALGDEQPNPFAGLSSLNPLRVNAAANPATARVRRYLGSKSAAEDYQIAQALARVQKWENNPGEYERPKPEEVRLARRFEGRENPRYQELIREAAARERRERLARQASRR